MAILSVKIKLEVEMLTDDDGKGEGYVIIEDIERVL